MQLASVPKLLTCSVEAFLQAAGCGLVPLF